MLSYLSSRNGHELDHHTFKLKSAKKQNTGFSDKRYWLLGIGLKTTALA